MELRSGFTIRLAERLDDDMYTYTGEWVHLEFEATHCQARRWLDQLADMNYTFIQLWQNGRCIAQTSSHPWLFLPPHRHRRPYPA